jgi:hypothetical protein
MGPRILLRGANKAHASRKQFRGVLVSDWFGGRPACGNGNIIRRTIPAKSSRETTGNFFMAGSK